MSQEYSRKYYWDHITIDSDIKGEALKKLVQLSLLTYISDKDIFKDFLKEWLKSSELLDNMEFHLISFLDRKRKEFSES